MASTYFSKIIDRLDQLGLVETVTWKQRQVSDSVFDDTTKEPEITWNESQITAVIRPTGVTEIVDDLKAADEIVRIFTASAIAHLDRIARGSKIYEIQPVEAKTEVGYYTALMRRLVVE